MDRTRDGYPRTRLTGAFERRVAAALQGHLEPQAPVVVACSGGPDSTAALIAVARVHPGPVIAATFDHAMRVARETAVEREVVRWVADDLGVPVVVGRATSVLRGEDAARNARYRWLARVCVEAGAVACVTGHTLDDQAETVLLRLARGTGGRGAAGMAPDAPWPVIVRAAAPLRLLRPLMDTGRPAVETYLAALGVQAARDPSNDSLEYARNRIRKAVLPALTEVNAGAATHLASFAERQREDDEALSATARAWLDQHATVSNGAVALPRAAVVALPLAIERRVLAEAGARLDLTLGAAHLEALGRLLRGPGGGARTLPGGTGEIRGTVFRLRRRA